MASDIAELPAPRPASRLLGHDAFELIAKGASHVCVSRFVVVWIVSDDLLETVAAAGADAAGSLWSGATLPVADVQVLLAEAPAEGAARLLAGEDWPGPGVGPGREVLLVPLHDEREVLRGLLTIEVPEGDWQAELAARGVVGEFVQHVCQAVVLVLEREALSEQMRLADAARRVVRNALGERSRERLLDTCYPAVVDSFRAEAIWIQTFDGEELGAGAVYASSGETFDPPPELLTISRQTAHRLLAVDGVSVTSLPDDRGEISEEEAEVVFAVMRHLGFATVLFVPLGAGGQCLGNLVLARTDPDLEWTDLERAAARDIGHDLGNALLVVHAYEREHVLVRKLRDLDDYRTEMIATVAHELRNPLTAVLGHLEMLSADDHLPVSAQHSLAAMGRGADRLSEIVNDLLLLSRVTDPDTPVEAREIDLRDVAADVLVLASAPAELRRIGLVVQVPDHPVKVMGDPRELDQVLLNLVGNALKYTPDGGSVTVSVGAGDDEVVMSCADDGLGISAADQEQLFTEFFRSNNPAATAQPGTGLGLAICRRIVERHAGRIEVESELGRGSVFRVHLPAR